MTATKVKRGKKESPQELARAIRNALDAAILTIPPADEEKASW